MSRKSESQLNAEANGRGPVYGPVVFGIPAERKPGEKWGKVSCVMLEATVPILGAGLSIKTAIYANLIRKSDGVEVEASAYLPKKVLQPTVEGAADALLAHIENAAVKYAGYETAYDGACKALLGFTKTGDPAKVGAPVAKLAQRPKLVRQVDGKGRVIVADGPVGLPPATDASAAQNDAPAGG